MTQEEIAISLVTLFTLSCNGNDDINSNNHTNSSKISTDNSFSCSEQAESYSFEIPTIYTITFISLTFLCSILYYFKLVKNRQVYIKHGSIKSYITRYILTGWKFKSMYGSLFTQLFDQVSDISVILQLYNLSQDEDKGNVTCYHMNTYYLFLASLIVFLFYRFLSSFLIYRLLTDSHSPLLYKIILTILQFFDLSFIITLKINYQFQNITPCNPQRYITNLEAIFEAAPQFIIQLYFIITLNMKQNSNGTKNDSTTNVILVISLFFSLVSIVSKKLSQDKECVNRKWQTINLLSKKRAEEELEQIESATEQEKEQNLYYYNTDFVFCSLNAKHFIHRIIWRLFIILHRLILWMLIWRIIGGVWFISCILYEFTFYAIIYFFTSKNVFFESIMGYILQDVTFIEQYERLKQVKTLFLYRYMILSTVLYSIVLCVLFALSESNGFDCCIGMNLSSFFIEWFVVFGIFCLLCFAFSAEEKFHWIGSLRIDGQTVLQNLFTWLYIYRHIVFVLFLFLFNYYLFISLIFVDLIFLSFYTVRIDKYKDVTYEYFLRLWIELCAPVTFLVEVKRSIFLFHCITNVVYCLVLLFFTFYSLSLDISFVNDYNDTIYFIFFNDDSTRAIFIFLLSFCCVLSVVIPFWTHYLVFKNEIINRSATNERKLSSMSSSGDIYGICEMIEFAGIKDGKYVKYNSNVLKRYLKECVETDNFKYTVFTSLNFFQQYQIMKYLTDNYNIKIAFKSNTMKNELKKQINSKEFLYQFQNNRSLLTSYMNDCFDSNDRDLVLKYGIEGDSVQAFYCQYIENLGNTSINSVDNMIIDRDVNNLSEKLLVDLVNIAEQKLDNSEKGERIKSLLFKRNILYYQWNELLENNCDYYNITKYWSYIDEQVM